MTYNINFSDDIDKAIEILKKGGIILYPTDTIWGLGCDATNDSAIEKILTLKKSPINKSMLILVPDITWLSKYLKEVPEMAINILNVAIKPITIIYPGAINISNKLIADDGSIGIRVTSDKFCKSLLTIFKKPIVSTSANFNKSNPPSTFREIDQMIVKEVDYVVKWRQNDTSPGKASEIIKIELNGEIKIIRPA